MKVWPTLLLIANILLKLLDISTTVYIISKNGIGAEKNPFVHNMIWAYGVPLSFMLNGAIYFLLVYLLHRFKRLKLQIVVFILMLMVVLANSTDIILGKGI